MPKSRPANTILTLPPSAASLSCLPPLPPTIASSNLNRQFRFEGKHSRSLSCSLPCSLPCSLSHRADNLQGRAHCRAQGRAMTSRSSSPKPPLGTFVGLTDPRQKRKEASAKVSQRVNLLKSQPPSPLNLSPLTSRRLTSKPSKTGTLTNSSQKPATT